MWHFRNNPLLNAASAISGVGRAENSHHNSVYGAGRQCLRPIWSQLSPRRLWPDCPPIVNGTPRITGTGGYHSLTNRCPMRSHAAAPKPTIGNASMTVAASADAFRCFMARLLPVRAFPLRLEVAGRPYGGGAKQTRYQRQTGRHVIRYARHGQANTGPTGCASQIGAARTTFRDEDSARD